MFRIAQYNASKKYKIPSSSQLKIATRINNRKIHAAANKIKKMIKKSSKDGDKSIHLDYNFLRLILAAIRRRYCQSSQ
jgi:hypothetical protein